MIKKKIKTLKAIEISKDFLGDGQHEIDFVSNLDNTDDKCLAFYKGNDLELIKNKNCGILIVNQNLKEKITSSEVKCIIFSDNPFVLFAETVNNFFDNYFTDEIGLYTNNKISKNAYVESKVTLGKENTIYPNASIYNGTIIGNNCEIQSGTVVGGIGMTYFETENGYKRMAQLGNVILEDNVEIGCNTTILRGILESTIIKKGSKIGNHVNVGHSTEIGENCYISAGAMIGGVTKIGSNSWIAPGVSIRDHISLGKNCTIGVGSVVVKDTEENGIYYGNPARLIRKKEDK